MTFGVKMIWKNLYFTIFERFLWGVDKGTPSLFGLRLFSEPIIFWFTGAVEKLKEKKAIVSKLEKMPLEPSSIVNVFNLLYIRDEFGKVLIDSVLSYPFSTI